MTALKSAVLSARIPKEVIREIDKACKKQGISRSQWIVNTLAKDKGNEVMKLVKGGKLEVQTSTMPVDLQNTLAAAGILTTGMTLFAITREVLLNSKKDDGTQRFTHGQIEFMSLSTVVLLVVAGIGAFDSLLTE